MIAPQAHDGAYIGGRWVVARGQRFEVENPATGEVVATVGSAEAEQVDEAVAAARSAFPAWSEVPTGRRAALVQQLGRGLAGRREDLTAVITSELGMPLYQTREVQVGWPVRTCMAAPDHVDELMEELAFGPDESLIPSGVAALITPWNFPLHQLVGKVVAALLAGCTVVGKPSDLTPLNALILAEEVDKLDLPPGTFNLVNGDHWVGRALVDAQVDVISFTGSTRTGRYIAGRAGERLVRTSLELGGKSPSIILPGADLRAAVQATADSCWFNAGQCCNALSLLYVPTDRLAEAEEVAVAEAASVSVGDPQSPVQVGAMVSRAQRKRAYECVNVALEQGARGAHLGAPVPPPGWYMRPTVLSDVTPEMDIFRTEVFGPVLCIVPYPDPDDVVRLTNEADYGLYAAVWGPGDVARQFAHRLRVGQVEVNGHQPAWDAPFGGFRSSGLGRERGPAGVREFLESRVVAGIR